MHIPWVEILVVMRHVALTEIIAIGKHVQICFCCPRLAFVHKRNCLCLYWAYRRSVPAKYLLRYESRVDSIAVTRFTELVRSLARDLISSHTRASQLYYVLVKLSGWFLQWISSLPKGSLAHSLLHIFDCFRVFDVERSGLLLRASNVTTLVSVSQACLQEALTFTEILHPARWIAFSLSIKSLRIWRQ